MEVFLYRCFLKVVSANVLNYIMMYFYRDHPKINEDRSFWCPPPRGFKSIQVSSKSDLNDHQSQQNSMEFLMKSDFFKQAILMYQCRQPTTIFYLWITEKVQINFLGTWHVCIFISLTSVSKTSFPTSTMAKGLLLQQLFGRSHHRSVGTRATLGCLYFWLWRVTLPKFNMEPKNDGFQ